MMMIRQASRLVFGICLGLAAPEGGKLALGESSPESTPLSSARVYELLDQLEDVRLLFTTTAYRIHTLDTLLRYGRDFGMDSLRPSEALGWHERSLELFEWLKSVDDGGQGLAAWIDAPANDRLTVEQAEWMETLVGDAAYRVLMFHDELEARIETVRAKVAAAAESAGHAPVQRISPQPWEQPEREIGRNMGFVSAWFLWMNHRPDSEHAALDRQQGLDVNSLLDKARKMGVNAILPEFRGDRNAAAAAWPDVEPEPGEFDFSRLDANIADIARHGMRTDVPVRSLDTDPPAWLVERYGDAARMGAYDDENGWKPASGVSLFESGPREAFLAYLTALCRHLDTHHREHIAAIALDPARMALSAGVGYSPAAREHFQAWLSDRYGNDIGSLNSRWEADYAAFDEVPIPAPRDEPPLLNLSGEAGDETVDAAVRWNDWLAWRKAWVAEHYQWQIDAIREALPGIPIQAFAISASSHHAHSERPVAAWSTVDWGQLVDLPSSAATSEPIHALIRSVGGGRFGGQQAEQNFGAMFGGAAFTAFLKDTLFTIARNGPDMIQRYFYSPGLYSYMDRQATWSGAYSYRLKMQEMHRLAPLIENTRMAPGEIAVLWSESSFDQDATRYSRYGVLGTAYALMCAKVHYDMLVERDLDARTLQSYPIVIVPEQRFLSDRTLELLRDYVKQGGTLYATGVPGMFDERGVLRRADGLHPLADCFGADIEAFTPIQAVAETFLAPTRPNAVWDQRERGAQWHPRGHLFYPEEWSLHRQLAVSFAPREGAEVLHRFVDGSPAMVRHRYGAGTAVIFGYPFGHEFAFSNTTEMSFGKLYPHYAFPVQMVNLHHWLGTFLREELGLRQRVQVPVSRMMRFTGTELSGPTMTYPSIGESFQDKRQHTAAPNHSFNIGWREREGVGTHYLTVFNRDSAYAVGRGFMNYMASPTYGVIRINRSDITAVYDVLTGVPVPFVAGDRSQRPDREGRYPEADSCISFEAVLPSYFGRVYAIATEGDGIELFDAPLRGDVLDSTLRARVAGMAVPQSWPEGIVLDADALREWLEARLADDTSSPVTIVYAHRDYAEASERLATALRAQGVEVEATSLDLRHRSPNHDPYYPHRQQRFERPFDRIDIFIGNEHTNASLADLTAAWQATRDANPRQLVSVNRYFPGGTRFVLQLTHPFRVDRGRGQSFDGHYHRFTEHPREVIIGASGPEGALAGVEHLLALWFESAGR